MNEQPAYSMKEFAALFGKKKWWSYRLKYQGKIDVNTDYGVEMVPASQIQRIEESSGRYLGKDRAKAKGTSKSVERVVCQPLPAKTSVAALLKMANKRSIVPTKSAAIRRLSGRPQGRPS